MLITKTPTQTFLSSYEEERKQKWIQIVVYKLYRLETVGHVGQWTFDVVLIVKEASTVFWYIKQRKLV